MIKTTNLIGSISRNAGGLFESVRRLVQSLDASGMEVRVLGVRDEFTDADAAAWQPVNVQAFQPSWPKKFGYSPGFLDAMLHFLPDVVHTHGLWLYPSIVTNQFHKQTHRPYIISAHGMLDPWAVRNSRWKKVIAHWMVEGSHLRQARCLRALCEPEARAIRELKLKNEIAVIPNGIDLPTTAPVGPPPWGGFIEPGRKVLLFLGRIHPKKGLPNLLKAWAQIQRSVVSGQVVSGLASEWTLAIAGWDQGGHESEIKKLATELRIPWADVRGQKSVVSGQWSEVTDLTSDLRPPTSVLFLGPRFNEAKAVCYHSCDGFILPSFSEGVPMAVLEAWAHSKPVVMTPECNLPEGFAMSAAISIETNVESIVRGLEQLVRSRSSDLCGLGANGKRLVSRRFAWPRIAEQMTGVYQWMIGGGPKPDCVV